MNSLLLKETDQCYLRETIVTIYVYYMENIFNWRLNVQWQYIVTIVNKGNNKITELRTMLQRESQNS